MKNVNKKSKMKKITQMFFHCLFLQRRRENICLGVNCYWSTTVSGQGWRYSCYMDLSNRGSFFIAS